MIRLFRIISFNLGWSSLDRSITECTDLFDRDCRSYKDHCLWQFTVLNLHEFSGYILYIFEILPIAGFIELDLKLLIESIEESFDEFSPSEIRIAISNHIFREEIEVMELETYARHKDHEKRCLSCCELSFDDIESLKDAILTLIQGSFSEKIVIHYLIIWRNLPKCLWRNFHDLCEWKLFISIDRTNNRQDYQYLTNRIYLIIVECLIFDTLLRYTDFASIEVVRIWIRMALFHQIKKNLIWECLYRSLGVSAIFRWKIHIRINVGLSIFAIYSFFYILQIN